MWWKKSSPTGPTERVLLAFITGRDYRDDVRAALEKWQRYILMIADADLRIAHERFVDSGEQLSEERKQARKAFIDAISEGGQRWDLYLNMLRGSEAANVIALPPRKGA